MKRNISDLLDAYIDESVDLNGTSLLSSSRIKELTLSRINQKTRQQCWNKEAKAASASFFPAVC